MSNTIYTPKDQQDWLNKRYEGIGASESSAILGVSEYKTPLQVWYEKVYREPAQHQNYLMRAGQYFELGIIDWLKDQLVSVSEVINTKVIYISKEVPYLFCTPDAVLRFDDGSQSFIEVKYVENAWHKWDNGIPLVYQIQCQHQMFVAGLDYMYLGVYIVHEGFRHWEIKRDDDFIETLVQELMFFWNEFVLTKRKPPASYGDNDIIKKLYPTPEVAKVELPQDALSLDEKYLELKEAQELIRKELDVVENKLKMLIGDAEVAVLPTGNIYTYKQYNRKEVVQKASTYRTLKRKGI